jgi:hypothetical protein
VVVLKSSVFWDITTCNLLTSQLIFQRNMSTLGAKGEHASPECQLNLKLTTWRYTPEDRTVSVYIRSLCQI